MVHEVQPGSIPSRSVPHHYSPIIPSLDFVMYSEVLMARLKKGLNK
jgi:hypothetical protein